MIRSCIILVLLVFLTACLATEQKGNQEWWKVVTVSSPDFPVKAGMTMCLSEDYVNFTNREQSVGYSILKSNDRLGIDTGTARLLFSIEKTTDSTMRFHELYSSLPLKLTFTRITNQK